METIKRKVSLEPLITRYPVCYPSIKDGEISLLTSDSLEALKNAYYGCIPLGINEEITGPYSGFTEEMSEAYSGSTIFCYTLQKWMNEFERYYSLIRSDVCHGEFENAVDYYSRTYPEVYSLEEAERIDENFKRHGGDDFYNWLIDNYFIMLDLKNEYSSVSGSCSYDEWCEYVDNVGCDKMPFPAAVKFLGELSRMHELYSGKDCSIDDNCCECVDYKSYGGDVMYDCVSFWMSRVRANIMANNIKVYRLGRDGRKAIIPKTSINFMMTEKIEDLGVLVSFSKEFIPGHEYRKGEICDYDNITRIMVADGVYNKSYFVEEEGGVRYWEDYYDVYLNEEDEDGNKVHEDEEDIDKSELPPLSGRTVSSLDSFIRKEDTVDGIGNVLPGYFRPDTDSYFVQPAENSLLGFMYQPGTYSNIERLMKVLNVQLYKCDFLQRIEFFYRDLNGNVISDTSTTAYRVDDVNEKIQESISSAEELYDTTPNTGIIYADFHYYKESIVTISNSGEISRFLGGDIKCVDHCTIEEAACQYHMSKTESYPLRYYKVNMDVETHYSDDYQKDVNVCMCDFTIKPSETPEVKHNAEPYFRKEELQPFIGVENPVDNIYIDRGYATVLDRHLRIGEVTNYEQLEKYGNGIFQIFNADEEVV